MEIQPSPVQQIHEPLFSEKKVSVFLKREDLSHPQVSGNKWRKLKYNLEEAQRLGHKKLLTFGGAYSNHIYAVAAAAQAYNFESIGVIRGEETTPLNYTLSFAKSVGMNLSYMDRSLYKLQSTQKVKQALQNEFGSFYLIPEGGTNKLAIQGCTEIIRELEHSYDYYCLPVGTGGTIAGIISALNNRNKVLGFSALKGDFLRKQVENHLLEYTGNSFDNWTINTESHFGGYAKVKPELLDFMKSFELRHSILLDPVYTAKSIYKLYELINSNYFTQGSQILFIHTGGLQGRKGFGL